MSNGIPWYEKDIMDVLAQAQYDPSMVGLQTPQQVNRVLEGRSPNTWYQNLGSTIGGGASKIWDLAKANPAKAAGVGLLGGGLLGGLLQGGPDIDIGFDREDIENLIRARRQQGATQIGQQLSQANVAAAGGVAARGLGDSTIALGALGANRAAAMRGLGELEAGLAQSEAQMLSQLAQMEMQAQMYEQQQDPLRQLFGTAADIGGMLMFL